jgi:apolipoprotein N-acyltransferase
MGNIKRRHLWLLVLASGLLLFLAWPPFKTTFLVFIALVPLLILEEFAGRLYKKPAGKVFLLSYCTFLLWNSITTYWIWYASPPGAMMAIVLNSLLMTIPFWLFHLVKRQGGRIIGYIALVCFWLSLEMLHLNWDAPWPWLNLGNAFAVMRDWIQWYEYTGTLGGTIWIWAVNFVILELILFEGKPLFKNVVRAGEANQTIDSQTTGIKERRSPRLIIILSILVLFPIIISYLIKPNDVALSGKANIVAVQPNIDPYNEKFDPLTYSLQIGSLIELSEKAIDSNTLIVTWPETAIAEDINEQELFSYASIARIHEFLKHHPRVKLITGVNSNTVYQLNMMHSPTARLFPNKSAWYDVFNAALQMDHTDSIMIYHKSKLVPGVEKMPYPRVLGFLEHYAIDMGGSSGSLGSQDTPTDFRINDTLLAAPIICYESIFGAYVSRFVKKGAGIITIITNDGWWHDSPGYKQHLYFGALRAIETRRFISRAANTGVSCFILPSGKIIQQTSYWKPAVIKSPLYVSHRLTFYTKHGDYLGWIGVFAGGIFILFLLSPAIYTRKKS